MVQRDLETMNTEVPLYQMIGPVIVPKQQDEVKKNVQDKLTFINRQLE